MDQANILIIGGGVIGCAIARAVSSRWQDVFLVEQFPKLGMATSTPSVVNVIEDLITPDVGLSIAERAVEQSEVGGSPRHLPDLVLGVVRDGVLYRVDAPQADAIEPSGDVNREKLRLNQQRSARSKLQVPKQLLLPGSLLTLALNSVEMKCGARSQRQKAPRASCARQSASRYILPAAVVPFANSNSIFKGVL